MCFHFKEIELKHECDIDSQFYDSVSNFDSILTPISLPDYNSFPQSALNPVPIHHELESPILQAHIPLWENKYELDLQLVGLDPIFEPILTAKLLLDFSYFP